MSPRIISAGHKPASQQRRNPGAAGKETLPRPGGLITLAGDQCDGDPRVPMLPATWAAHPV
ncbi:hypothetical protein [Mycobacterium marinum]|uniref:PPW family C-terminal domain-containing PPE protein n=1 Tax=Mycobacterium marinum TaxID=1781 RepID=UPI001FB80AA5|nr:hypothetical protein [Mycobacterium marinum]